MTLVGELGVLQDRFRGRPEQTCKSCLYFHIKECRARPPRVFIQLVPAPRAVQTAEITMQPHATSAFPMTQPENWCGEWEPRS